MKKTPYNATTLTTDDASGLFQLVRDHLKKDDKEVRKSIGISHNAHIKMEDVISLCRKSNVECHVTVFVEDVPVEAVAPVSENVNTDEDPFS